MNTPFKIYLILVFIACLIFAKNYYNSGAQERRDKRDARRHQKQERHIAERFYSTKP
jgi:hypothetical protein